ncbi:hypothetical protein N9Z35_06640 [Alphaproteobacteria bacterium]|nr:hypothetical protein [Alphaproteobacteria bacterium]
MINSYIYYIMAIIIVYFLTIFVFSFSFYSPIGAMTRMGSWPEVFFWGKAEQPSVKILENGNSDSEIIVLGDSFSNRNIWQSYLQANNTFNIQTYHLSDAGCLDNWLRHILKNKDKKNKYILLEVVEQSFLPLFRTLNKCKQKIIPNPLSFKKETLYPDRPQKGNLVLDLRYIVNTLFNFTRINSKQKNISFGNVNNVKINNGQLFSNIKSERMLYLSSENEKIKWKKKEVISVIKRIKIIQNEFKKVGLNLILLIIPDKSTQYSKYIEKHDYKPINIFNMLSEERVEFIDLYKKFEIEIKNIKDFYLPNDNHLSFKGYKILADIINSSLRSLD